MLYQIYEAQRALLEPFAELALATSHMFANPSLPLSHALGANRMAAGYNLLHRLAKDYEKPKFEIDSVEVNGNNISIHERIAIDKPFCELRRFKRYADDTETLEKLLHQPPVLIVAPLSGHYATLLRDTVRTMLKDHKVYITDWKNARDVPLSEGTFDLSDYVNYVQEFIRYIQENNGECHVVSVCQPTVPVLAAVSLMASRGERTPESITMMGGPVDASRSPTVVNDLAVQRSYEWFENNVIHRVPTGYAGEGRRVYPGFLQYAGFVAMNPNRHATSHYDYFKSLVRGDGESTEAHRKFYDEYNAVLDMDAEFYLETINTVFQEFKLVRGTWEVRGVDGAIELVRPQDITNTAVLAVEGELDDIAGIGQTQASIEMCTGVPEKDKKYYEAKGAGHYGIFSGRRWRENVYPVLRDFIDAHSRHAVSPRRRAASQQHLDDLARREAIQEQLQFEAAMQFARHAAMHKPAATTAVSPEAAEATQPAAKSAKPDAKRRALARKPATTKKVEVKQAAPATPPATVPTPPAATPQAATPAKAEQVPAADTSKTDEAKPVVQGNNGAVAATAGNGTANPGTALQAQANPLSTEDKPTTSWRHPDSDNPAKTETTH